MNAINGHSSSVACDHHHHHRDNMMLPKPATTTTNNATAATATTATAVVAAAATTTTTGATTASVSTAPAISGQQAPPPRQPQPQEQQWMMPHLAPPPPLPQQQQRAPSPPPAAPSQHQQEHPEQQRPQELQQGQQQYSHEEQRQQQQQHHQRLHPPQQQQPYAEASASLAVASGMTFPTADAANDEDNSEYLNSTIHPIQHQQQQQQQHHTNNGERPPRRKRPKSMSFAYLQGQLLESSPLPNNTSNDLSSSRDDIIVLSDATARGILKTLLDEHRVRLKEPPDDVVTALAYVQQRFYMPKQTVVKSMSIDQTLQLAKMDQLSFLGSFLMVLEEAEEAAAAASAATSTTTASVAPALGSAGGAASVSVSALDLIKRCCLAIHPSKIPPLMDAEEMAIAALEFLGSNSTAVSANGSSTLLPDLPLIRFVKYEADVRKRFYEKVGSWKLNDDKVTMQQVTALEDVFLSDCSDYRFLRRGVCGPRMTSTAAEDALYLRGKHKVPSNSSSNSTSNKRNSKQQQQSAAVRKAAAAVAAANSTVVGGGDVANHDNHPIGEQQPSGFLTSPITLEDAGGETGELHNSRSHSPSFSEECYE